LPKEIQKPNVTGENSNPISSSDAKNWRIFPIALTALFFAFLLFLILRHQMWRDEVESWELVRHNPTIPEIFHAIRYEGHPPIWFLILRFAQLFTADMRAMQAIHAVVAAAIVFVIASKSPWTAVQKVMFAFGYYIVIEYGEISRNYSLGILLGFIACALICAKRFRPICLGIVLFLMGQTNAYAMTTSIAVGMAATVEWHYRRQAGVSEVTGRQMLGMAAIILAGIAIFTIELRPPADLGNQADWGIHPGAFNAIFRAFLPIPQDDAGGFYLHFWNTNILDKYPALQWIGAIFIVLAILPAMLRRPASATLFVLGFNVLVLFLYVKYIGYMRHQGHLFILYLQAYWLSRGASSWPTAEMNRPQFWKVDWAKLTFNGLLLIQVLMAIVAVDEESQYPFSGGKLAADFIRTHYPPDIPIIGFMDVSVSTIGAYLQRDIFYPEGHRMGTNILWDKSRQAPMNAEGVARDAIEIARRENRQVLVILSTWQDKDVPASMKFQAKIPAENAIEVTEIYKLYVVQPPKR
jgi:uncharacterized phage-associated protein